MFKANELRIGNYYMVLHEESESYHKVDLYFLETQSLYDENPRADEFSRGWWCRPIPLTESILLKAGFKKIPHFTVTNSLTFDIGRRRLLSIGCVGTPNEMLWLQELIIDVDTYEKQITDLICIHNFDYDGKLYLHKLQNIVKDLSDKELEINL